MNFFGCDFDEVFGVVRMMMSKDAFADIERMDVMRKTAADLSLKVFVEWSEQHGEDWKRRSMVSPEDAEDDVSYAENVDEDEHVEAVDRSKCGWMFVVTIDILLDEQVHVVLVDYQILFSLLLLHCHNHLPQRF